MDILIRQKVGSVPVIGIHGRLVGVVTETDLLKVGVVTETDLLKKEELHRDPDSHYLAHMSYRGRRAIATAETAGDLVNTHPATVRPEATVVEAARLMDRHQVTCLPVTGENGQLLVGLRVLLRAFLRPDEEIRSEIIS